MKNRVIILSLLSIFITACATPQVALKKEAVNSISSVDQVLYIPQNNLDVSVSSTNPGNTGIIGALIVMAIDSARQSSAEEESAPIINALQDYDFRNVMLESMNAEVINKKYLPYEINTRIDTINSESNKSINYSESQSSAVLFSFFNYRLESGNLIIKTVAEMYPKIDSLYAYRNDPSADNPLDEGNAIYRKTFTFTKQGINADNIKTSLSEGAVSIAKQILTDLSYPL